MGFSNTPRGGGKYINFKEGKLVNDGNTFGDFTGTIVDLSIDDNTYNNETKRRLTLYLLDDDTDKIFQMQFNLESGYCYTLFQQIPSVNPKLPVTIAASSVKLGDGKSWGKVFVSQEGKNVAFFYSKNNEKNYSTIPPAKELVVGKGANKKTVKDNSAKFDFMERVFFNFLEKRIRPMYPNGHEGIKTSDDGGDDILGTDDLPF